jgi:hypothetical protein
MRTPRARYVFFFNRDMHKGCPANCPWNIDHPPPPPPPEPSPPPIDLKALKELQKQVRFPLFSVFFASFCSDLHFLRQNTQMAHDLEKTKIMLDTPAVWLDENVVVKDYCQFLLAHPHLLRLVVINLSELLDKPDILEAFESTDTPRKQRKP